MANPRKVAVKALIKIENDGAYSNLAVADILKTTELEAKDKALASALIYGVLDRKITLDYVLSRFMKNPIKKTAPITLQVLRTALYQIMYMDKIPPSAAVNEAVKIIKKSKESRNSGFVNGVLRSILRQEIALPQDNSINSLKVRYSCPEWIIKSFTYDYGLENTVALLEESLKAPPVTLKINTALTNKDYVCSFLCENGINFKDGQNPDSLDIEGGIDIANNELYKKGYIYAQDSASQKAVSVLSPKKGERVLDMCAAPGSKSFTMACLMENAGEIIACDLYEHRTALIEKSAKRLGLNIIKALVQDGTEYNANFGEFDCILCDVPCSGLGVLRRKPDIKYNKIDDFFSLEALQYKILTNAVKYLKKGGRILYSTCTLRKAENEDIINKFLEVNTDFSKAYEHTFMPHTDLTDGFYCALLERE